MSSLKDVPALAAASRWTEVLETVSSLSEEHRNTPRALVAAAQALVGLGDHEAAIVQLANARLLAPGDTRSAKAVLALTSATTDEALVVAARYPGDAAFAARAAIRLLKDWDFDSGQAHLQRALSTASGDAVDKLLRRRFAFALYDCGLPQAAEAVVASGRLQGAPRHENALERARAAVDAVRFDGATWSLLEELAYGPPPWNKPALHMLVSHLWRYSGITEELLHHLPAADAASSPDDVAFQLDHVGILHQAGDLEGAADVLRRWEGLEAHSALSPSLAKVACTVQRPCADEDRLSRRSHMAEVFDSLSNGQAELLERLRDPATRIAVVGNSSIETGAGRGAEIDAHDLVIRFNKAPVDARFSTDYGTRLDILATARGDALPGRDDDALTVAYGFAHLEFRNRKWAAVCSVHDRGIVQAGLPSDIETHLATALRAPPSMGLKLLVLLKRLRGRLDHTSVYGFSFTDQIGNHATSAHYFQNSRPSMLHDWAAERLLFEDLFRDATA